MSRSFRELLSRKLTMQYDAGLRRELKTIDETLVDFSSNDYLGLARSKELHAKIEVAFRNLNGNINGSTGSRLLTGNSSYIIETEKHLAAVFKSEAGLICNSGYVANLAVLSSLPRKGDTILYDELSHASIKDGARLSLANRFSFRHNDLYDLELKLKKSSGHAFIVIESIYSMDGDRSPLKEICELAGHYDASIVLDEAHSTGMFTSEGAGLAVSNEVHQAVDIRIYTFGKAGGVHGAVICGRNELRDYLINFSRPFIYTTALSPHSIVSIRCAFDYLREHPRLQHALQENIHLYQELMTEIPGLTINDSPIQTIPIAGNSNVRTAARLISAKGFDVRPILSPTVPLGQERIRICLHSFNTPDEIRSLYTIIRESGLIPQPV